MVKEQEFVEESASPRLNDLIIETILVVQMVVAFA